jgi:phospholipid/cholesterol/gamma-HCH transport system substrate-binding protein
VKVTRRKKFLLGLFMATGIIAGVLIFFWLGVTRFFEEGKAYAAYFDQSVQGLSVDAPVKFRGVTIGRVTRIRVAPDARHVEVIMLLEEEVEVVPRMVAQLRVVGITGVMFVEIDILPEKQVPAPPDLAFKPPHPVIPTRPSEISQFFSEVERILAKFNEMDLVALTGQIQVTLQNFDRTATAVRTALDQLEVEEAAASFRRVMGQMQEDLQQAGKILTKVNGMIDRQQPQLQEALADFRGAMANLNQFTRETADIAAGTDDYLVQLNRQLQEIGRNLEQATGNLSRAVEEFADQPSQLFFREAPPPRELPE